MSTPNSVSLVGVNVADNLLSLPGFSASVTSNSAIGLSSPVAVVGSEPGIAPLRT